MGGGPPGAHRGGGGGFIAQQFQTSERYPLCSLSRRPSVSLRVLAVLNIAPPKTVRFFASISLANFFSSYYFYCVSYCVSGILFLNL